MSTESARPGATGVPFFVLDRAYGLAGAQPVETLLSALQTAYDRARRPQHSCVATGPSS